VPSRIATLSLIKPSSDRCSNGRSHGGRGHAPAGIAELHHKVVTLTVIEHWDRVRIDRSAIEFGRPNAAASVIRVDD